MTTALEGQKKGFYGACGPHNHTPIERSLRTSTPEQATLSTDQVVGFLSEAGPLLEQSGFGVPVPAFWGGTDRLRVRASAKQRRSKTVV